MVPLLAELVQDALVVPERALVLAHPPQVLVQMLGEGARGGGRNQGLVGLPLHDARHRGVIEGLVPHGVAERLGHPGRPDPVRQRQEARQVVAGRPPVRGDQPLLERLSRLAREAWCLFGLGGYARVDFRVDDAGQPWILEINANPCLSPDAGFAAALTRASIPFPQAIARILQDALR